MITDCVLNLPHAVAAIHDRHIEDVTHPRRGDVLNARDLKVVAGRICDLLDPDGTLADDADHVRRRDLSRQPPARTAPSTSLAS